MIKNKFVELKLNNTLIMRERTHKQLKHKLKCLRIENLLSHPKASVLDVTTNIPRHVGNLFEATL
jgi:hypothetical protein